MGDRDDLHDLAAAAREASSRPPASRPRQDLVWRGAMRCHGCGYQWQARRNTPPARCPSCGKRTVPPVMVPKGCLAVILVAGSLIAVLAVAAASL